MTKFLEGNDDGSPLRIAVVVADFNSDITSALLDGCLQTLRDRGVNEDSITVAHVPGAFELPGVCDKFADSGSYDAVIALGAVIRGDTPHFDYVAGECARGIMQVMLARKLPVVFGVLTTDTLEQAQLRASTTDCGISSADEAGREQKTSRQSNKGAESAVVALYMSKLYAAI
jgi:6,7-dimethyl-8-ribityllumazine synthase